MASAENGWIAAATLDEIPSGHVKLVVTEDEQRIALCNVDGQYCAPSKTSARTTASPLDQGQAGDDEIECPRHGALQRAHRRGDLDAGGHWRPDVCGEDRRRPGLR